LSRWIIQKNLTDFDEIVCIGNCVCAYIFMHKYLDLINNKCHTSYVKLYSNLLRKRRKSKRVIFLHVVQYCPMKAVLANGRRVE